MDTSWRGEKLYYTAATDKFSYFRLINSLIDYHLMQSNLEMEFENVDEMEFFEN